MKHGERPDPVDTLKALWHTEQPPERISIEHLRAEVARRSRRMLLVVAGELVLTAALIALTVSLLGANGPASSRLAAWLGLLWLTWLVAAGFATWNRWGVWRPSGETAQSYLALSEERTRRRRRVANFVLALVAVQLVGVLVFGEARAVGLGIAALYAGWATWYRRKAGRELHAIRLVAEEFRRGSGTV